MKLFKPENLKNNFPVINVYGKWLIETTQECFYSKFRKAIFQYDIFNPSMLVQNYSNRGCAYTIFFFHKQPPNEARPRVA
jgi:hypothetical protein